MVATVHSCLLFSLSVVEPRSWSQALLCTAPCRKLVSTSAIPRFMANSTPKQIGLHSNVRVDARAMLQNAI
jgi:hypothetical protein